MIFIKTLTISSTAFNEGELIPAKFTCDGENINPPISGEDLPKGTKSLVLIMCDVDASYGNFDHWIVWNIPVTSLIKENSVPGIIGKSSSGKN